MLIQEVLLVAVQAHEGWVVTLTVQLVPPAGAEIDAGLML